MCEREREREREGERERGWVVSEWGGGGLVIEERERVGD